MELSIQISRCFLARVEGGSSVKTVESSEVISTDTGSFRRISHIVGSSGSSDFCSGSIEIRLRICRAIRDIRGSFRSSDRARSLSLFFFSTTYPLCFLQLPRCSLAEKNLKKYLKIFITLSQSLSFLSFTLTVKSFEIFTKRARATLSFGRLSSFVMAQSPLFSQRDFLFRKRKWHGLVRTPWVSVPE